MVANRREIDHKVKKDNRSTSHVDHMDNVDLMVREHRVKKDSNISRVMIRSQEDNINTEVNRTKRIFLRKEENISSLNSQL